MGNTATSGKTRAFSLEQPAGPPGLENSPRADSDTMKTFDFPAKKVLCYQSSAEYPSDTEHGDNMTVSDSSASTVKSNIFDKCSN